MSFIADIAAYVILLSPGLIIVQVVRGWCDDK